MDPSLDQKATEQQPPSVVSMSSDALNESQYAQQLVQTYFRMLTVGCKGSSDSSGSGTSTPSVARCSNAYCKSNSSTNSAVAREISPTDAAILSVYLAMQAPSPLCIPIVSYFPVPLQQKEDRPETDEGDDDQEMEEQEQILEHSCSTPRRRLSSAVKLDLAFNINSHDNLEIGADLNEAEQREHLVTQRPHDGRRLSLPKQKLLDAIKKSFPGIAHRKRREVDHSSNDRSSAPG